MSHQVESAVVSRSREAKSLHRLRVGGALISLARRFASALGTQTLTVTVLLVASQYGLAIWTSIVLISTAWSADELVREKTDPPLDDRAIAAAVETIRVDDLKAHVGTLASDALQGRESGTANGHAASAYLVSELRKRKVTPAGDGHFLQEFTGNMRNVLATVRGRDARLADEVVVVCAHYDHVGYGTTRNSRGPIGYIHNGADDNASGTAGLLEVIEAVQALPRPPRRTLLFAFWDGEEKGLLGSKHWVSTPTLPLKGVKLVINADMIGRLRPEGVEVTGSRAARGLRHLLSEANSAKFVVPPSGGLFSSTPPDGLVTPAALSDETTAAEPPEGGTTNSLTSEPPEGGTTNLFAPKARLDFTWETRADSDHHPFLAAGIPAVMLHTGKHDDYHRPSDDADKLNYEGTQKLARLMLLLALHAAEADELPTFRTESRAETKDHQRLAEQPLPSPAPRLGITWDQKLAPQRVVQITEITPQSPAALAGFQIGDRIERFADHAVTDVEDFRSLVIIAPRETVAIVRRLNESEPRKLLIRLAGEPIRLGISWREDPAEPGCVILTQVVAHSPAARAGLKPLDRILSLDNRPIRSSTDFETQSKSLNAPVAVEFERDGVISTASITPITTSTVVGKRDGADIIKHP